MSFTSFCTQVKVNIQMSLRQVAFVPSGATLVKYNNGVSLRKRSTCRMDKRPLRTVCMTEQAMPVPGKGGPPMETLNKWKGSQMDPEHMISQVKFNSDGLVAAVAQQVGSNEVLMMAWMSAESIRETLRGGRAVYFSRSRQELWRKGDTSGQVQFVHDVLLDCDGDTILLVVDQIGVACHTGRRSCFFKAFRPPTGEEEIIADVMIDPKKMYGKSK